MAFDIILQTADTNESGMNAVLDAARRITGRSTESFSSTCSVIPQVDFRRQDPRFDRLDKAAREFGADLAVVPSGIRLTDFRAFFFDMDSTFVYSETLDEMARIEGIGDECARITQAAMDGTLKDYAESLRARVKLLEGHGTRSIDIVWQNMRLFPGLERLVGFVLARGLRVYIVSSGFSIFTKRIVDKYGLSGSCSNVIEIDGDHFTGRVSGPAFPPFNGRILDADGKLEFVKSTMEHFGATPLQSVCFGDGSNDVKMLDAAGLAIGHRPKPVLRPYCDMALRFSSYESVLNLFADVRAERGAA